VGVELASNGQANSGTAQATHATITLHLNGSFAKEPLGMVAFSVLNENVHKDRAFVNTSALADSTLVQKDELDSPSHRHLSDEHIIVATKCRGYYKCFGYHSMPWQLCVVVIMELERAFGGGVDMTVDSSD
jgi:hypothetical protein